ncbi:MAG: hypothetical protein AAF253_10220 [Pseudomonadota bacterium]
MSVYQQYLTKSERFFFAFLEDTERYLQAVTPAEKAFAVCVFGLVLMYFIIRKPKTYEEGGGMGRQFLFALTIVMLMGFGIGWVYGGDIEAMARTLPISI